ncbi:hypothetical protein GN244_ATG05343 [Phytophthora infestans]|uniref:Uncharacterized protein n=1 Tax=Phytophthora infestans TaxID=4787 RepID=A0A833S7V4_PHYIN|nr:hypothetical protein GN244_ATG05343 [Phytophthora infestans]KAF4143482.1 hypothetical protein GN958_ATG07215 [Phytophthora infestans]
MYFFAVPKLLRFASGAAPSWVVLWSSTVLLHTKSDKVSIVDHIDVFTVAGPAQNPVPEIHFLNRAQSQEISNHETRIVKVSAPNRHTECKSLLRSVCKRVQRRRSRSKVHE